MTRRSRALTWVAWNVKVNRGRAPVHGVRRLRREHHPVALALVECRGVTLLAVRVFLALRHRTIRPAEYSWQDAALAVRRSAKITDHGVAYVRAPWRGPEGTVWSGKAIPWAVAGGVLTAAVHMPYRPEDNGRCTTAVLDQLRQLAADHDGPVCFLGDWNMSAHQLQQLARAIDGLVVPGVGVDHAVVRGLGDAGVAVDGAYGSDHPAVVYRLDVTA